MLNPLYHYRARKQTVKISYQSFSARQPTEYILCPYLLKEFRNRWFIFGARASDLLLFNLSLDRICSLSPADVPFREHPQFDTEHFFDDVIGVSKNLEAKPRLVRFWASREQSKYIQTKPLHSSQQLESQNPTNGSCIFSIRVVINIELYSVLMSYGPGIRVLSPRLAVNYMKAQLKATADLYEAPDELLR